MVEGPEEGDALEEAEVEGRIADGRECAGAVGDGEDEEDDVDRAQAALVHAHERADEQDTGAGGAEDVGENAPRAEQQRVSEGRSAIADVDEDAAGGDVKAADEGDEGVVLGRRVEHVVAGVGIAGEELVGEHERAKKECNVGVVVVPEGRADEGHERDGGEQEGEREDEPEGRSVGGK